MNFYFADFQSFLLMDGHGTYVWSALVITLLVMVWLIVSPLISRRALLKEVARDIHREQDRQSTNNNSGGAA